MLGGVSHVFLGGYGCQGGRLTGPVGGLRVVVVVMGVGASPGRWECSHGCRGGRLWVLLGGGVMGAVGGGLMGAGEKSYAFLGGRVMGAGGGCLTSAMRVSHIPGRVSRVPGVSRGC